VNDLQQSPVECDSGLQCQSFNYFISHILLHMLTLEKLPVDEVNPKVVGYIMHFVVTMLTFSSKYVPFLSCVISEILVKNCTLSIPCVFSVPIKG